MHICNRTNSSSWLLPEFYGISSWSQQLLVFQCTSLSITLFSILKCDSDSLSQKNHHSTKQTKQDTPTELGYLSPQPHIFFFFPVTVYWRRNYFTSYFCKVTKYKVDHLLHRLFTLLISFPYICLVYFMAFCIGFLRVEFPFSKGPLLTQPWCTLLSLPASLLSFFFFFFTPSRHMYPFRDRMLLKLLWPKFNYSRLSASQVKLLIGAGRQELSSFPHKFTGLVWAGQDRVTSSGWSLQQNSFSLYLGK